MELLLLSGCIYASSVFIVLLFQALFVNCFGTKRERFVGEDVRAYTPGLNTICAIGILLTVALLIVTILSMALTTLFTGFKK